MASGGSVGTAGATGTELAVAVAKVSLDNVIVLPLTFGLLKAGVEYDPILAEVFNVLELEESTELADVACIPEDEWLKVLNDLVAKERIKGAGAARQGDPPDQELPGQARRGSARTWRSLGPRASTGTRGTGCAELDKASRSLSRCRASLGAGAVSDGR